VESVSGETVLQGNEAISRLNSFVGGCEGIDNYIRSFKSSSAIQVLLPSPEAQAKVWRRGICVPQPR